MGKVIFKVIGGIIISTAIMAVMFSFFLFANPLRIYNVNFLNWIPVLICVTALYVSGKINHETPLYFLPLLLLPLAIFELFNFFFYPLILSLLVVGILILITARSEIGGLYKASAGFIIASIFTYHLLAQPLILENEDFGRNENGELINATTLWDFRDTTLPQLPSLTMVDQLGNDFDIKTLEDKTYFIAFWSTSCKPCLKQKHQLEQLKNYFQYNPNVEFVDISIDENKEDWTRYLAQKKPSGLQLFSKDIKLTKRLLKINSLPLHFIVDPTGTYKVFPSLEQANMVLKNSVTRASI